jgi:ABC-2 type transport system ATP-binding protein
VIITVDNLTHSFGDRPVLRGLSFQVPRGASYGLLGPNGCGKSTLFRILTTLLPPQSGAATIDGAPLSGRSSAVRRKLGVIFQSSTLDLRLSVEENLLAHGHLYGLSGPSLRDRTRTLMEDFDLLDRRADRVSLLSGGFRRRVEIARALIHEPPVLLMDEASSGLDPAARRSLWLQLHRLREQRGLTILFTTHLMDEAENATTLLLLSEGRALAEDAPQALKARVGGDVVLFHPAPGIDPESLASEISTAFHRPAFASGPEVRVETPNGHRFLAEAMETLPGRIHAAQLHRPTLEDVFVHLAGHPLEEHVDA